MFTYNKSNNLTKRKLQENYNLIYNTHLDQVQYFSVRISGSLEITTFFGIIEKLILSGKVSTLQKMKIKCQQHLQLFKSQNAETTICEKFISVITQILKKIKGSYQQTTTVLKDLYRTKQNINGYLKWLSQSMGPDCLSKFSYQCKINYSKYEIRTSQNPIPECNLINELCLVFTSDYPSCHPIFDVRVIQLQNGYHLLYPFSSQHMDSISKLLINQQKMQNNYYLLQDLNKSLQKQKNQIKNQSQLKLKSKQNEFIHVKAEKQKLLQSKQQIQNKYQRINQQVVRLRQQNEVLQKKLWSVPKNQKIERETLSDQVEVKKTKFKMIQSKVETFPKPTPRKTVITMDVEEHLLDCPEERWQPQSNYQPSRNTQFIQRQPTQSIAIFNHQSNINPKRNTDIFIRPPAPAPAPPAHRKTNFLKISFHDNPEPQKYCQVCEQVMIPFRIFTCQHNSCSLCLVNHIKSNLQQGKLPTCLKDGCGKKCDEMFVQNFLKERGEKQLLDKFFQFSVKESYKDKLFTCPDCKQVFEVNTNFVPHCGKVFCRQCLNPHPKEQKCDQAGLINILQVMSFPTICPTCNFFSDKDDGCEHVTCSNCKAQQIKGFCSRCSAIRSPIMEHDGSYHRTDCKRYTPNPEVVKKHKNCSQCAKVPGNQSCKPPTESFKQFIEKNFSQQFCKKLLVKRGQYDSTHS